MSKKIEHFSVSVCKNRRIWKISKIEVSNFAFLTSNSDSPYQIFTDFDIPWLLYQGGQSQWVAKIRKSAIFWSFGFFISYMRQAHHVVHHWIAIELGYPKKVLIPWYNVSPRIIYCVNVIFLVFLDMPDCKKQPSLNFYFS